MNRIKEILKEKDMTINELAGKLGISRVALSSQINRNANIASYEKIAAALEVEISDLFSTTSHRDTITCPNCGAEFIMKKK